MTGPAIEDIYPLTPLQHTMLFHALAAPRVGQHLQQHVYEVTGPVTPTMLRAAFEAMLARHTALRTGFVWQDVSRPVQVVWADVPLPWQVEDLRTADESTAQGCLERVLAAHRATGFDLTLAPLLRVAVVRTGSDRMLVAVTDHHLIVDGWSEALLASELAEHLRAAVAGRPARLPAARPFGEYLRWLAARPPAEAVTYWRSRLGDLRAPTPLGVDRRGRFTPPEIGVDDRRMEATWHDPELSGRLRVLRERGVLPATLAHAAWALLLAHHSGRDDVTFGVTLAGRGAALPSMDTRIGMYANTLPLRLAVDRATPVGSLLAATQQSLAELSRYEHSPHPLVQAQSGMRRGDALFDSVLAFQGFFDRAAAGATAGASAEGVKVSLVRAVEHTSVPLAVSVTLPGDSVWTRLDYDANRFDEAAMADTLRRYQRLTAALAADPDAPLGAVWLPGADVRERVLAGAPGDDSSDAPVEPRPVEAGGTPPVDHAGTCRNDPPDVVTAVWRAAGRWPDAVAVRTPDATCDYAELVRRATRLAQDLDVGTGQTVAILARPSVELVVAVLAVLRVGGACWVADPATWDEAQLRASGARLLLADGVVTPASPPDRDGAHRGVGGTVVRSTVASDATTAWWAPTAGADGTRVPVGRRAISVAAAAAASELDLTAGAELACRVPPPSAAAWCVLAPLTIGGCAVLGAAQPTGAGTVIATPGQWRDLVAEGWRGGHAVVVGEPPSAHLRTVLAGRAGSVRVVYGTAYGAGIASVATLGDLAGGDLAGGAGGALIGRAVPGARLRLLDADHRPVPAGVPGHLWLAGDLFAAGRSGQDSGPDGSLRTGDRARHRADGTLELLGNDRDGAEATLAGQALREIPGIAAALVLTDADDRLLGWFECVEPPGPDPATVSRLLRQVLPPTLVPVELTAVERLPVDPDGRWDRVALLTAAGTGDSGTAAPQQPDGEHVATLLRWGDGGPAGTQAGPITELIEAHARRAPTATAIDFHAQPTSYGELWRSAEEIAGRLATLGVRPGETVALCLPRGPSMVATVLAILTTGAAYLPVDPALPAERIRFMLADARVTAQVSTTGLAGRMSAGEVPLLCLDAADPVPVARRSTTQGPPAPVDPNDAAYVLYTSGSTGVPKAVVVPHRAVVDFVTHINAAYRIRPGDRVLAHASLSFDVSVFDLFATLGAGATVVLADDDDRLSAQRLQRLLADRGVTVAELPPALMPSLDPDRLADLRLVSVGGEPPAGALVDAWQRPDREFWNGYGPTETTVAVTLMRCQRLSGGRVPPIGRPMPNHRAYVVDTGLCLVAAGEPGELCIAGPGLAQGYLGRPGLTAERFVPDPCGPPGERMYRTGDLVRWNTDGQLEFLGRVDRQVKIRGFRVELGEIESTLCTVPGVAGAVVELRPDPTGTPVLVAYVTGAAVPELTTLRALAGRRLPYYMLPDRLVHLDEVPLTATGKVDRARLPAPPPSSKCIGDPADDPSYGAADGVAAVLATEIVGPLLDTRPAPDDDFFALGGDSLGAAVAVAQVRERFGVDVSLTEFLADPTVARLTALVALAMTEENR